MEKCRPGPHDSPCGPTNSPYGDDCACGCSASDWCNEQCATMTSKNVKQRLERFYALELIALCRDLDADELMELTQLRYQIREYLKRTTPRLFAK